MMSPVAQTTHKLAGVQPEFTPFPITVFMARHGVIDVAI